MSIRIALLILCLSAMTQISEAKTGDRSKNLEFEGELVEGMNKIPVNSMENIEHDQKKNTAHLYKKKTSFQEESKQLIQTMGISQ